jgi:two-component system, OmpR family, response regulator
MAALDRILFVDDEPDIRTVACLALEDVGGLTVKACASGAEAIEGVHAFRPDLILLDVMMPGMDGPAVLRKFQEMPNVCDTPVIFFTAKTQKSDIDKLQQLGAVSVLRKPFDPLTLADEIREVWNGIGTEKRPEQTEASVRTQLDALTETFVAEAESQIFDLRSAVKTLAAALSCEQAREDLDGIQQVAHKLAGRGGTFGYPEISRVASHLEDRVIEIGRRGPEAVPLSPEEVDELLDLTDKMARGLG